MRRLRFGIVAGLVFVGALRAQQVVPDLFSETVAAKGLSARALSVEAGSGRLTPVRTRLVRLNLDAIDPDAPGSDARRRVRFNLFPGLEPEIERTGARRGNGPGRFQWFGRPGNDPAADAVLSVIDGRVSGSLALREGFFQIRHVEGDVHEITEVLFERSEPIDDALPPPASPALREAKALASPPIAQAGGDPVVDILIVYTPEARRKVGGSEAIQDRIALAIAEANASFVNSAAAISFRLAGMAEVPISGTQAPSSSFLSQVTASEPAIQSMREYYGADLVSVWVEQTNGGVIGIGWLNQGGGFASYGYSVVAVNYSNGPYYTFAHEGGHNLGAAHDRAHASNPGAFSYSYGYRYDPNPGGGFFTIMSYSSGCGGCSPTNRWSNPNLLIDGVPSGVPQNQPDSADNAATLTQIGLSASAFRAVQSPALNQPPTAANKTVTATSALPKAIGLTGSDPDGDTVYFDVVTSPVHGILTGGGANWTYTADLGYSGADSFDFQARDSYGGFDIGTVTLNVQLPASNPPNVSLAQPTGGPFTAPATVNLVATASDSDGTVDHVDFYANGSPIGSKTSATNTYTFQWTNVLDGSYSLTAVAQDNLGLTTTSSSVSVTVAPGGGGVGYTARTSRLYYSFDEGAGATVFDHVGANDGAAGGAASWTSLGLKGGYVNSGASSFTGNKLSAASGDAFTVIWVGKLGAGSSFQTLFSMSGPSASNVQLRYYQPTGYFYLTLNNNPSNFFNGSALLNKVVMIALRCSGGACSWRIGGAGAWIDGNIGAAVESAPSLWVGAPWFPLFNSVSSLFWVYGDSLTNAEIDANFQYAGVEIASRGGALDGYTGSSANHDPVAQNQNVTTPYQTAKSVNLSATDEDSDPLAYSIQSGPAHGSLSGAPPNVTYTPASGYSGPDSFTFLVTDGRGGSDTGLVSITVGSAPNTPPNISLATPPGGPFTAPASITLAATATDPGGSVDHVQFFANGSSIGTKTSSNSTFSFNWTGVAAGTYTVFARAFDNLGATKDSASVSVTINSPSGGGSGYTTRMSRLFYAFDEGSGLTVLDHVGSNHGAIGGSATWTSLGLKGGDVNSGVSSFSGNRLSAASGNAFTVLWVGRLNTGSGFQTLFSMNGPSATNLQMRYYQPGGYLYLTLNNNMSNFANVRSQLGKVVMIAIRCAAGSCSWRVGGSGAWMNGNVGNAVDSAPRLRVGVPWSPLVNSVSSLFWVYGDSLTDAEIDANFEYAGSTMTARGATLDGYSASISNHDPAAQDQTVTTPYQTAKGITLSATDVDLDPLTYSVQSGPAHGALSGAAPNLTYAPASGYSGSDSFTFRVTDGNGGADTGLVSIAVGAGGGGSSGYTTRMSRLFYAFDEGAGLTVLDHVGSNHGAVGGSATWTALGLKGGSVNSGVSSFDGNKLSAASGNAFTIVWVGRLNTGASFQTLFAMAGPSASNVQLRYYQPNGYLYLTLNNNPSNYFNASSLVGKVAMIALRCSGGACSWRVGGPGASWIAGNIGSAVESAPHLHVGAPWSPLIDSASALFWVYGASLTNAEIDANFQYAGATVGARGASLDGYIP